MTHCGSVVDLGRLAHSLRDAPLPAFVVDLDAFDANARRLLALRRRPVPMRVASKSVRVPDLLARVLGVEGFAGVLGFAPAESAWIAEHLGVDVALGYPLVGPDVDPVFAAVRGGARVSLTVDDPRQVAFAARAAAEHDVPLPVWLDVDLTWRPLGLHLGVRRSPVRDVARAREIGAAVRAHASLRLVGVLAYEAAVAGLPDRTPGSRLLDPIRGLVKRRSIDVARARRAAIVHALRADGHDVDVVNGGGTGSVPSTSEDPTVTEITVGSGLFAPHQFDRYDGLGLEQAGFVALRVVRIPAPGWVTVAGGGFIASGAGPDKAPHVVWPIDGRPSGDEGWGEVQTPIRTDAALEPGDVILTRHAKAGEVLAHFREVLLCRDDRIVGRARTLRGLGLD